MTGQVEQRIDLGDAHALGTRRALRDLVAGFDLSLLEDAEIEAGSAVRDEQRRHLRLVHADADAVAGDARLRHFEQTTTDLEVIADVHLVVRKPVDGDVFFPELPIAEVVSTEPILPIAIGRSLIDEDSAMLAAVPRQIALAVAIDIEPPHHAPALNRRLPDRSVDCPSLPRDVARQPDIDRKQARHRFCLNIYRRDNEAMRNKDSHRLTASLVKICFTPRRAATAATLL